MNFSNFFSYIQETPWYFQFLSPVVDEIDNHTKLLDIGTGSGKLLQLAVSEKNVNAIGIDTNESMLKEATKKVQNTGIKLLKIEAADTYPFNDNSFDVITICNVLFNLNQQAVDHILTESVRLLKDQGRIIVLTPTGKGNFFTLTKSYFSLKNLSIYIWFYATRNRAGPWTDKKQLIAFSENHKLNYKQKIILKGFTQVETLTK